MPERSPIWLLGSAAAAAALLSRRFWPAATEDRGAPAADPAAVAAADFLPEADGCCCCQLRGLRLRRAAAGERSASLPDVLTSAARSRLRGRKNLIIISRILLGCHNKCNAAYCVCSAAGRAHCHLAPVKPANATWFPR